MATLASANLTGIRYITESTWGTTPNDPTTDVFRYTGEGLTYDIESTSSNEISSDRMTADLVQTSQSTSGNVDFELSFGSFDTLMEGVMFNDFGTNVGITAQTDVDFNNTNSRISQVAANFDNVVVGQWVKVQGATNAANNGYFRVTAVEGTGAYIDVDATLTTEAAGQSITITGQRLTNGTSTTNKSFSIEKTFDVDTDVYNVFTGCYVDGMSLNFETGSILTGSFTFVGKGASVDTTRANLLTGTITDNAATTTDVMNAVSNLNQIEFDNTAVTASIQSMSLELGNNLREQQAIGSLQAVGVGLGRFDTTGSISLYFQDLTEYNKYLNNTSFSIAFRVDDGAGNAYIFSMPNVEYESMPLNSTGLDTDIILEGSYRGLKGTVGSASYQLAIDRCPVSASDLVS